MDQTLDKFAEAALALAALTALRRWGCPLASLTALVAMTNLQALTARRVRESGLALTSPPFRQFNTIMSVFNTKIAKF